MIDVSIVIIHYGNDNLVINCLTSFYRHWNNFEYEIIVIDNNEINRGYARACNEGIKKAKGKYILFLNNDIIFIENVIKKLIDYVGKYQIEKFIIGPKLLYEDGREQESIYLTNGIYFEKIEKNRKLNLNHAYITGAFMFCDAEFVRSLMFDEKFFFSWEEVDLQYRARKAGGQILYFNDGKVIHIKKASVKNKGRIWRNYHLYKSRLRFIYKRWIT
jgi:hypothetical protein